VFWPENSGQGLILITRELSRPLFITVLALLVSFIHTLLTESEIHVGLVLVGLRIIIQVALLVMDRILVGVATIVVVASFSALFRRLNFHVVGMSDDLSIP